MSAWRPAADGLAIAVRLTPRGGRNALTAGTPDHFAARVSAPPVDGAANAALIALVAKTFGVSRGAVRLIAGDTARLKRLFVTGDPTALARIAATLYGQPA
ncbi:DUF167 domain-containing protein [Sphingomonas dokdonensis]|uniref:DUF167 domain-containing protein n=1 Tax=Sphingomonas dokdonensis TaxID=344880 RepID=UPI000B4A6AC9|nr:DUF167 family protein [Sphingomonas dokdonensis]